MTPAQRHLARLDDLAERLRRHAIRAHNASHPLAHTQAEIFESDAAAIDWAVAEIRRAGPDAREKDTTA
jgi:hypothetical protein